MGWVSILTIGFHTINSKAHILESEHALKLLLGQNPELAETPQEEFDNDPALHLTRLLRDKIDIGYVLGFRIDELGSR